MQIPEACFTCTVCLDFADKPVESDCCHQIFCEKCTPNLKTCPNCRRAKFVVYANEVIKKIIGEFPTECPYCKNIFQRGNILQHKKTCEKRTFACQAKNCNFTGEKGPFLNHLITAHEETVLERHRRLFQESPSRTHVPAAPVVRHRANSLNSRDAELLSQERGWLYY